MALCVLCTDCSCLSRKVNLDSIQVWVDPWIPSLPDFQPRSAELPESYVIHSVADLVDPDSNDWKVD